MSGYGGPARLLRAHGPWAALVTAVVMAAAFGVSRTAPVEYRSTAIVVVESRVRPGTTPVVPDMGTEKELASSGVVLDPAARSLGVEPGELLTGLRISVSPDANVLTFAYTSGDAVAAHVRAGMIAAAYVRYRNGNTAAAATATEHATLVTAAEQADRPVSRPLWIDLGLGLVLGLLLGVGSALIRDRLNDRIRGRADFERVAGVTVLATVPRERPRGGDAASPVTLRDPESPAAESYRYLRARLRPLLHPGGTTILVASAGEGEGRTTTAANLAVTLALAGRQVILVDADLRRPGLHTAFGLENSAGLADLLAGDAAPADVLRHSPLPRLRLVTAGPGGGAAADLLEGRTLAPAIGALRRLCDVVVLDSAALLSVPDGIALAAVSDQVLLVGDYRRTTRGQVGQAVAALGGTVVSGVLLNGPRSAGGRAAGGEATPRPVEPHVPLQRGELERHG